MKRITVTILLITAISSLCAQTLDLAWAKEMGGNSSDFGYSTTTDATGNVYVTGFFTNTVDFDPGPGVYNLTSVGSSDIFVSKFDASGNLLWANGFGGTAGEQGNSIALDASGNVYTTGFFYFTVDFDPGAGVFNLTSRGGQDVFVSKLDTDGNFVWAKRMGGTSTDQGRSIAIDGLGNVLTTGYFNNNGFFDPNNSTVTFSSSGLTDVFVSKLDTDGNFVWAKKIGGTFFEYGNSIAIDGSDNVLITGFFERTVDFDPGAGIFNLSSVSNSDDIFITKLDASGNFAWAVQMGGTNGDAGTSISVDASDNVITLGTFYFDFAGDPIDFDPGAGVFNLTPTSGFNYSSPNLFVSKLNSSGNFVWAKQFGGNSYMQAGAIDIDLSGNVYATGSFTATVDFDPGSAVSNLTSTSGYDIFVFKLNNAGSFGWAEKFGGTQSDVGYGINVDATGNIVTTGYMESIGDFAPGSCTYNLTSVNSDDIFIQKISQTLIAPPSITNFSPSNGPAGTVVTITGTNFDPVASNNIVSFNGLLTTVTASTSTSITTVVPVGALDGPITVSIVCKSGTSATAFDVTGPCNIPLYERSALIDLYNSTNGASWLNSTNWNSADESTWFGITVIGCRVTEIDLSFNQLTGTLLSSITDLKSLQVLKLFNNNLSGQLPDLIGNLTALTQLQTQHNLFSGVIPPTLLNCTALANLNLEENQYGGVIPTFLGSLSNLYSINLAFNQFYGPIPKELGNLPLTYLSVAQNNLDSTIPPELGNLSLLTLLDLSRNQLTGSIPTELGNLSSLQSLQLWTNQLTGAFPVSLENLTNLQDLNLSDNQLTGPVVCNFVTMPGLKIMMLNDNQFDGDFPTSASSLTALQTVSLAQNQFTSIPSITSYDLYVENNNLDFGDLEPSISTTVNFTYIPQARIAPGGYISFAVGGTLNIPFTTGGTSNSYQWYNAGTLLSGATSPSFSKSGMAAGDAGLYYVQITSPIVSGLTLESEPFLVFTDICSSATSTSGDLDLTFNPLIAVPTHFSAIGVQSTGKILASIGSPASGSAISRFNSDGSLDNAFSTNSNYFWGFEHILVQADDKILATYYDGAYTPDYLRITRLLEDGSDDSGFSQQINTDWIYAIALQPDGNILVSYNYTVSYNVRPDYLSRLLPDGTIDGSFNAPLSLPANAIKVQPDGFILLGGWFPNGIIRLDDTGAVDLGFSASINGEVTDIAIQPDGKIIVVGSFDYVNNIPHRGIVRLNTDGSIDNTFVAIGISDLLSLGNYPTKIALQSNGQMILSGIFSTINGTNATNLVRLNSDGTVDCLFNPGSSSDAIIPSMLLQSDGQILIAGDFTQYDGTTRNGLARINNGAASCLPASQRAALVALYNSTSGANWTNKTNWLSIDESTWYGVTVNACNVTDIDLEGNNLVGTIPPEIENLPGLNHLTLTSNTLSGTIPSTISNCTSLSYLLLDQNNLTGSIPVVLGSISAMQNLNLAHNSLSGAIPKELGNLPSLSFLELQSNQLTGSIPTELGNVSTMEFLRLSDNQLTGTIPTSLGNLPLLFLLDLNQNKLTGSIPKELGQDVSLQSLNLYDNQLSGSIPPELGNLTELITFDIFTNQLTGSLPIELSLCTKMTAFEVGGNQLSGTLPVEYASLVNLTVFQINQNNFTGAVPVEYLAWTNIQVLFLSNNQLTGIPTFPPALITNLEVQNNRMEFDDLEPSMGTTGFTYNPQANLPGGSISLDAGSPLTIPFSTPGSANQYQWFKNGVLIPGATSANFSILTAAVSDAGNYTVDITSTIVPGLTLHSLPFVVTVLGNDPPVINAASIIVPVRGSTQFDLLPYLTDPNGNIDLSTLVITSQPTSGAVASLNGTQLSLDYSGLDFSGTDLISVKVCDTKANCTTQQLSIEVVGNITVYNAVSPGNDGLNDIFYIDLIDILPDTKNNNVKIFNRWGDVVFETSNYNNTTSVFRGFSNSGSDLPSGVYFYKITFASGPKPVEGFISLKR